MNKTFKGGNVLWVISFTIVLLCAAGLLFLMLQEKTKRIETEQELSETKKAKRVVELNLDRSQLKLIQLKEQAQMLARQFEQEKKNYQSALEKIDKKDIQVKKLENNLVSKEKQRTTLANALAQLRERYDSLEEKFREVKRQVKEFKKEPDKSAARPGVKLKKIIVKPKKKLSAKVLVVNREFHFVVIDLGKKDAVSIGDEFVVYRNSQEIGKVKVEKVYDAMCTASILPGSQKEEISEDNIVKSF